VQASYPGYLVRLIGGAIFFAGMLLMAYNLWMTVRSKPVPQDTAQPAQPLAASA
jgi:cytochrome c oxidase cbb3-type subunit 1